MSHSTVGYDANVEISMENKHYFLLSFPLPTLRLSGAHWFVGSHTCTQAHTGYPTHGKTGQPLK